MAGCQEEPRETEWRFRELREWVGQGTNGAYPTPKNALETLLGSFYLPSSASDLNKLPMGSVLAYDAQGSVGFQTQLNFLRRLVRRQRQE